MVSLIIEWWIRSAFTVHAVHNCAFHQKARPVHPMTQSTIMVLIQLYYQSSSRLIFLPHRMFFIVEFDDWFRFFSLWALKFNLCFCIKVTHTAYCFLCAMQWFFVHCYTGYIKVLPVYFWRLWSTSFQNRTYKIQAGPVMNFLEALLPLSSQIQTYWRLVENSPCKTYFCRLLFLPRAVMVVLWG